MCIIISTYNTYVICTYNICMYILVHNSIFCLVTQSLKKEQSIQCLHHLERGTKLRNGPKMVRS